MPTMRLCRVLTGCVLGVLAGLAPAAAQQATERVSAEQTAPIVAHDVVREHDVPVPMRDGIVLRADVWRPFGPGPFSVLVYRTPYNKRDALAEYRIFARAVARGYAVIVQDVRGRYASQGEFYPYRHEGRDGYDTIEWAARQPWSDGRVGTFGLSYPGAVQWLAAIENPPHLKAMVPAMTYATPRNFFYAGGLFDTSWISWAWNYIAPDVRAKKGLPGPRTEREASAVWDTARTRLLGHLPLAELSELRRVAPWYYEWMRHPAPDPWWQWAELHGKYARTSAAVLNLSGWHDDPYGPDGATTNFAGLMAARAGQPAPSTQLLVGPWAHGVAATGRTVVGERDMGPTARIDYDETVLQWMDHHVRGIDNAVGREQPVRAFVMGDNRWREGDSWPLRGAHATSFYLSAAVGAGRVGRLGIAGPVRRGGASTFPSDPANPVTDPYAGAPGAHDYRDLVKRPDVLTFDSDPLEADVEVIGRITAEIFVSSDAPDLDLWVRLLDVSPDGDAYNLMSPGSDVVRASYRNGSVQRELLRPGRVYRLRLPGLMTANTFKRGHRIRVQISGALFPNMSRNLQSGALEFDSAETRRAAITVHHDRRYASRLILPVMTRGPATAGTEQGRVP